MNNEIKTREQIWVDIGQEWDLIVIGGGITGAGVFREAVRIGMNSLLVEQRDFSWGTSSRSSKLVHGGLRYLKEGKIGLTMASVQERERLLDEAPGLVDPLGFLLSIYEGDFPGRWTFEAGLSLYDLMALEWGHRYYSPRDFRMLAPHISEDGLEGGFRYGDALTDDSRLVLRVLSEGILDGGVAINYARAVDLIKVDDRVTGIVLENVLTLEQKHLKAELIINATGAWADDIRSRIKLEPRIRPLRGSHLVVPSWKLPVAQAVSFLHPFDGRPVMVFPWEGVTIVGTTDMDHPYDLQEEASISPEEVSYLMAAIRYQFPSVSMRFQDIISTFSGVRAVIGSGKLDPSKESRDHVVWDENGLITVTGGKLTTFRRIAVDALRKVTDDQFDKSGLDDNKPVLNPVDLSIWEDTGAMLPTELKRRLTGRYGKLAVEIVSNAETKELEFVQGTKTLWAEIRWSVRHENVVHLDDLMLRRTRLGLIVRDGGEEILDQVKLILSDELGWNERRWEEEKFRYLEIWKKYYSLPPFGDIPDWELRLARQIRRRQRKIIQAKRDRKNRLVGSSLLISSAITILGLFILWRNKNKRN